MSTFVTPGIKFWCQFKKPEKFKTKNEVPNQKGDSTKD